MLNEIKRGEIYMADLGVGKGSIQGGVRPVVIVSNPMNNKFAPTVNVLPITSKTKNNLPIHVSVGAECGLQEESTVLVEQMTIINKSQLTKLIGKCTHEKMRAIAKAIVLQMYLEDDLTFLSKNSPIFYKWEMNY